MKKQDVDEELIKELLENNMLLKLVATPFYAFFINYVYSKEVEGEKANEYTLEWLISELMKAGHLAEAGHLQLSIDGVPASLRGFSQTVAYSKNMLSN